MHELHNYEIEGIEYMLEIKTESTSLLDVNKIDGMYQEGYTQTKKQIDKIKEYVYQR